ncbi:hypothetical protein XENOCAPTIV_006749 [Xenoophorus captivus]|uniref:LIM zinc-binding domain-containing protein n=1 Tax=Xenoophorus captivus TaxID=1517983 RepID=A0ABV0R358_9TELE
MADSSHCFYCREDLGGKRFVRSEGKPVCVRCHTKFCANSCAECHRPISVETKVCSPDGFNQVCSESVAYKGNSWHDECFTCCSCKRPIASQSFLSKDDAVYCNPCYDEKFVKSCVSCKKVIYLKIGD